MAGMYSIKTPNSIRLVVSHLFYKASEYSALDFSDIDIRSQLIFLRMRINPYFFAHLVPRYAVA